MRLHSFFRSSASHRLRIALHLKGLDPAYSAVNLLAGQHASPEYTAMHPQGLVPALEVEGQVLIQSPAIIEWLEETYPHPPLLPADVMGRAKVRAIAAIIGCDMHPLHNGRVLRYLREQLDCDEDGVATWCRTWISAGFDAVETLLAARTDAETYCFGTTVTLADAYLIPQVASGRRLGLDVGAWPCIDQVDRACGALDAFQRALPLHQPDAVVVPATP